MQCQDSELVKFASPLSDEQVSATPPSDEQVLDEAKFVWTKGRQRGASLFGTIQDFHTGLEARIGLPRTDLWKAMEDEHVQRDDSSLEFIPPNSKVSTSPEKEWRLANATGTHGSHELTDDWILETGQDGRRLPTPQTLENLYVCDDVQKAKLRKEEVIALILYTGPMYSRYNAVLRLFPEETVKTLKGNKYTTTIHLIVSGVIKLSRCFELPKQPEDRFVYRGLCNLDLPDAFKQPNEYNVTGGVEFGLMSTSLDRDVAFEYARKGGGQPSSRSESALLTAVRPAAPPADRHPFPGQVSTHGSRGVRSLARVPVAVQGGEGDPLSAALLPRGAPLLCRPRPCAKRAGLSCFRAPQLVADVPPSSSMVTCGDKVPVAPPASFQVLTCSSMTRC